jgi:hypothetical protein
LVKGESESKYLRDPDISKGGTGDQRTTGSRYLKKMRVKEPSVLIISNPSKNPTGVSLKRTGIFCVRGYLIFSKKLEEKNNLYTRNWVFDFLTTAFIKPKNLLPRGVLQFLITVQDFLITVQHFVPNANANVWDEMESVKLLQ